MEEVKKSLEQPNGAPETTTEDKPEDKPVETPAAEDKPNDKPEDKPEDKPVDKPDDTPAPRDEVGAELENTNSVIRNRLKKQAEKYDRELADRDAKYDALAKKFEELKQSVSKQEPQKTRDAFSTDEEYVAYLTRLQIDADRAEQDKLRKEREAKEAEEKAVKDKEEQTVRERQERFVNNVNYCFDQPEQKAEFMNKVKNYLGKGLGDLLDACPVASDYLLASPRGPKVLDRLLTDINAFKRVFDPRGITPMDQFYELKELEREIYGGKPADPSPAPAPAAAPEPEQKPSTKQVPKYGKPGAQGGGRSADVYTDPKARRDEVRRLMGC